MGASQPGAEPLTATRPRIHSGTRALSVRGERYEVIEGRTPEITVQHARKLLAFFSRTPSVKARRN